MDAKSRANFINSVVSGEKIPCPVCNSLNDPGTNFCVICGTKLTKKEDKGEAFAKASDTVKPAAEKTEEVSKDMVAFKAAEVKVEEYEEEKSVFAEGLPSWDVLPPQVLRRAKKR